MAIAPSAPAAVAPTPPSIAAEDPVVPAPEPNGDRTTVAQPPDPPSSPGSSFDPNVPQFDPLGAKVEVVFEKLYFIDYVAYEHPDEGTYIQKSDPNDH